MNYFNYPRCRGLALASTVAVTTAAAVACESESFEAPATAAPDDAGRANTPDAGELGATPDAGEPHVTTTVDAGESPDSARPFELTDAIKVGYRPSFDPTRYSRACSTDDECAIVPVITNCGTCCSGDTAIRADDGLADLEAVRAACDEMNACSMWCGPVHAECVHGQCTVCGQRPPCPPGIVIELPIGDEGDWVVEATFDRRDARCSLDQASGAEKISCSAGSSLVRRGPRKVSFGLGTTLTPAAITVRVERDGAEVATETFDVVYRTIPGPSRRGCEPRECRQARHTLFFSSIPRTPGRLLMGPDGVP